MGSSFLDLPGETRNQIYDYYFEDTVTVYMATPKANHIPPIRRGHDQPMLVFNLRQQSLEIRYPQAAAREEEQKPHEPTLYYGRRLGRYTRIHGLSTNWAESRSSLSLACKVIYRETVSYLYSNAEFYFNASRRLQTFLTIVPSTSLNHLTSLHLRHSTYGEPQLTENVIWKEKHDARWASACALAAKSLLNLKNLHVTLHVCDSPLRFYLSEPWIQPLLAFQSLQLKSLTLTLSTRYIQGSTFADPALQKACNALHKLFAEAIRRRILGWSEEDAIVEYNIATEGKYRRYRDHLNFNPPW